MIVGQQGYGTSEVRNSNVHDAARGLEVVHLRTPGYGNVVAHTDAASLGQLRRGSQSQL